ncbi:hypothetical protein [Maledivibacter halophilus]|uniref:Uncharacterized protein n=1 Tax=Maledivibacter halophilus TaxID=36842 RepID=A0A1T5IGF1_9FIRM|nr:hypothetical protein [Maledivibacter halophilus]SKC38148.1 hypothetical protein SAMN02194393_00338 [Maledivibacter halophilus]
MKKLITKSNIDDFLVEENKFYVDKSMIITPGIKDILRNKGITIIYGERQKNLDEETRESTEENNRKDVKTEKKIGDLLINEFGISKPEIIEEITLKILAKINE